MNRKIVFPMPDKSQFSLIKSMAMWEKWNLPFIKKLAKAIKFGFNDYFTYHQILVRKIIAINHIAGKLFLRACKHGNLYIVNLIVEVGDNYLDNGLVVAKKRSYTEIVNKLIERGANTTKITDCMTKKSAPSNIENYIKEGMWYDVFYCSCKQGDLENLQLAINNGINDWNNGLYYAINGNQIQIARLMIDKGAKNLAMSLYGSCFYGHIEIAKMLINECSIAEIERAQCISYMCTFNINRETSVSQLMKYLIDINLF